MSAVDQARQAQIDTVQAVPEPTQAGASGPALLGDERMQDYFVSHGSHTSRADGMCAMEWVAYLANEPHSDSPECVCPTLTRFCVAFNDGLPDEQRQKLRPYLARTIGTRGDGLAERRVWVCMDWLARVYTPAWLSLAGLDDAAERLRLLPPVLAMENLERAMGDLYAAKREVAAVWGAAWWGAVGVAAWSAARDAVGGAAGDAARDAAGGAAGDAARDAAWWGAAGVAAGAAAGVAVWAAAWAAARAAAGAADRAAARAALRPTVEELQLSAFGLLDRMLPTEPIQLPIVADADRVCMLRMTDCRSSLKTERRRYVSVDRVGRG